MVGIDSLWPKALFLIVAFCLSVSVFRGWKDSSRKDRTDTLKLFGVTAFVAIWVLMMLQIFARELAFHHELNQLRPEAVESIEIGNTVIADPGTRSAIVHALNQAQWFYVNHGGWGEETPFIIHLKSGRRQTYHVAQYFRQPGAVLMSMSAYDSPGTGNALEQRCRLLFRTAGGVKP